MSTLDDAIVKADQEIKALQAALQQATLHKQQLLLEKQQALEKQQNNATDEVARQQEIQAYQERIALLKQQLQEKPTVSPSSNNTKRIIRVVKGRSKSPGIRRKKVVVSAGAKSAPSSPVKNKASIASSLPTLAPLDGEPTGSMKAPEQQPEPIQHQEEEPSQPERQDSPVQQQQQPPQQQQQHYQEQQPQQDHQDTAYTSAQSALKKKHAWSKPAWALPDTEVPDDQDIISDPIANPFLKKNNHSGYVRKVFPSEKTNALNNGKFVRPQPKLEPRLAWVVVWIGPDYKAGKIVVHLHGKNVDDVVDRFLELKGKELHNIDGLLTVQDFEPAFKLSTTKNVDSLSNASGVYGVVQEGFEVLANVMDAAENSNEELVIKQAHIYPIKKNKGM